MDVSKLEPADRNPKREMTTLIVILVLALVTGAVILYKYQLKSKAQAEEVAKGRAPEISQLRKGNYSFLKLDGEEGSFSDLTGNVTLLACFSAKQMEDSKQIFDILKEFDEKYKDEKRVKFLLMALDHEEQVPPAEVKKVVEQHGLVGDKWNYAIANGDPFLGYIKNELKFLYLAKGKKDGRWIVPQRIRLVDPVLKVRGAEIEYDFEKISKDQAEARKDLATNEKFKNDPRYKGDVTKIDLVGDAKKVIGHVIDYSLSNDDFDKHAIDEKKNSNPYTFALWIFGGIIASIAVLGYKVSRGNK